MENVASCRLSFIPIEIASGVGGFSLVSLVLHSPSSLTLSVSFSLSLARDVVFHASRELSETIVVAFLFIGRFTSIIVVRLVGICTPDAKRKYRYGQVIPIVFYRLRFHYKIRLCEYYFFIFYFFLHVSSKLMNNAGHL